MDHEKIPTLFDPAERAADESVYRDADNLAPVDHVAQVVPSAVMLLNEKRRELLEKPFSMTTTTSSIPFMAVLCY
jgi:hypothetical protein